MTTQPVYCRGPCPRRCLLLLALLLFGFPFAALAHEPPQLEAARAAPAAAPAPVPAWSLSQLFRPLENVIGNRRRMIQVLLVMVCVGLYIMMRK